MKVNLLITEEGWGLSSANWIIRHSAWSMKFLHDALTAAHVELQLFGDQDAMILNLMNSGRVANLAMRHHFPARSQWMYLCRCSKFVNMQGQ